MDENFLGRKCSKFVGSFGAVETFYDDNYQTESSILYSKDKKKWIYGPNLPKEINFKYASGVALNRSVVLFVGVGFLGSSICNLTLTYDFTSMKWTMRDDLPLGDNKPNFITSHIASSAIFHTKNESR